MDRELLGTIIIVCIALGAIAGIIRYSETGTNAAIGIFIVLMIAGYVTESAKEQKAKANQEAAYRHPCTWELNPRPPYCR